MRYEQVMQRAESDGGEAALLSGADPRHPREPVRRRLRRSRSCSPCQSFSVFTFVLAVIVVGVILNRGFKDFGLHKAFLYSYYMLHIYFSLNFHLLPFLPQIRKVYQCDCIRLRAQLLSIQLISRRSDDQIFSTKAEKIPRASTHPELEGDKRSSLGKAVIGDSSTSREVGAWRSLAINRCRCRSREEEPGAKKFRLSEGEGNVPMAGKLP